MKKLFFLLMFFLLCFKKVYVQNLISNFSFTETIEKKSSNEMYRILPGSLSKVKNWYLPKYINYKPATAKSKSPLYSSTYYYTSRDKDLIMQKKLYSNGDQLFENNLGFIYMYVYNKYTVSLIQQKLKKPLIKGKYCFKIKYKYLSNHSLDYGKAKIEFSFTSTDLKEYYANQWLSVPQNLIQGFLKDSTQETDSNTPWQQKCFTINLNGDEQFLTIGSLTNKYKQNLDWASYYIDDVELYKLSDTSKCNCELIEKDLRNSYNREFPLNKHISNDTLVMFTPNNNFAPGIITSPGKYYLHNIIAFMQRNPDVKIKFIEHNQFSNIDRLPTQSYYYVNYLVFFGISKDRITELSGLCEDEKSIYCGHGAEYVKIGFKFYK